MSTTRHLATVPAGAGVKFGSLFSGIEAASAAWLPLGWSCAWVAEIDPFACAVLAHHYPNVPNLGDVNRIDPDAIEPVDVVVFGSPCQSFSVAGKRLGLDDPRGNLALVALRLISRIRPRWVVFENVPGLLSSDEGRDFGAFLGLLGKCGYGFAYRVLDAQHFGVPQRRRRVFVVGYLGDWRPPAAVLFEPESLRGDPAPCREAEEGIARTIGSCAPGSGSRTPELTEVADNLVAISLKEPQSKGVAGSLRNSEAGNPGDPMFTLSRSHSHGVAIAFSAKDHGGDAGDIAPTLRAGGHDRSHANAGVMPAVAYNITGTGPGVRSGGAETITHTALRARPPGHSEANTTTVIAHSLRADGFDASEDGTGRGTPLVIAQNGSDVQVEKGQTVGALSAGQAHFGDIVALNLRGREGGSQFEADDLASLRAASGDSSRSYVGGMSVRRLTPRECERLQGFPDDYTLIPYRGKPAADGPRYRALGNSFAVPVVRWLGRRIEDVT